MLLLCEEIFENYYPATKILKKMVTQIIILLLLRYYPNTLFYIYITPQM